MHEDVRVLLTHLDDVGDVDRLIEELRDAVDREADIHIAGAAKVSRLDEGVAAWCEPVALITIM